MPANVAISTITASSSKSGSHDVVVISMSRGCTSSTIRGRNSFVFASCVSCAIAEDGTHGVEDKPSSVECSRSKVPSSSSIRGLLRLNELQSSSSIFTTRAGCSASREQNCSRQPIGMLRSVGARKATYGRCLSSFQDPRPRSRRGNNWSQSFKRPARS